MGLRMHLPSYSMVCYAILFYGILWGLLPKLVSPASLVEVVLVCQVMILESSNDGEHPVWSTFTLRTYKKSARICIAKRNGRDP